MEATGRTLVNRARDCGFGKAQPGGSTLALPQADQPTPRMA